jgi:HK97 family phage major capsid protein
MAEDRPDMLLGRPIFYTEFCQTLGTVGDLVLGNWSQYLEGTLQGPDFQESIHVRFTTNERTFRVTVRNDGQPWWKTALTPKKSTITLSPFVTLATRS